MGRGSGLRIGKILGIPIYLHSTWVFIFVAITYIIASQYKQQHPLWTDTQHWTVGVLTSLLFRSEEHTSELSHSQISYAVFCLKKKQSRPGTDIFPRSSLGHLRRLSSVS